MMNLDTLLGFPEGHLNRLADRRCPPVSPELARDTKNPQGFAEAAA